MKPRVWRALVHAAPLKSNPRFGEIKGAYVNVAGCANGESDFIAEIESALQGLDFLFIETEDIRMIDGEEYADTAEFAELVREVEISGRVAFGTFHTYVENEDMN